MPRQQIPRDKTRSLFRAFIEDAGEERLPGVHCAVARLEAGQAWTPWLRIKGVWVCMRARANINKDLCLWGMA